MIGTFPAVGQLWLDPLGRYVEVRREISGGDWECRGYCHILQVAPEVFRGPGWRLVYDPKDYGGKPAWEW